jgi:ribosomal protein S27AE
LAIAAPPAAASAAARSAVRIVNFIMVEAFLFSRATLFRLPKRYGANPAADAAGAKKIRRRSFEGRGRLDSHRGALHYGSSQGGIMPQPKQCPKCGGSMEEGFVLDRSHGGVAVASWVERPPETSLWTGIKLGGRTQSRIATWRCGRCGFLESYATGEPDGSGAAQKKGVAVILVVALSVAVILGMVAAYLAHLGR